MHLYQDLSGGIKSIDMRYLLNILCWLIFFYPQLLLNQAIAQGDIPLSRYTIDQWTGETGLNSNNLSSVLQTDDGFLWITTYNGLLRFDGVGFDMYNRDNLPFLITDAFYRTYSGPDNTLWFTTQGSGIIKYKNGEFKPFLRGSRVLPLSIRCLLFAKSGELWVGSNNNGAYIIQDTVVRKVDHSLVSDVSIMSMAEDVQGNIWMATYGNGLVKFS